MLDQSLKNQLKEVFSKLENPITLEIYKSDHNKQQELVSMLDDVVGSSDKLTLVTNEENSQAPKFKILKDGVDTGVSFIGIPGGHEFSSLVLGILNADGKGKFPDQGIINRIKAIKGPVNLKTYISLSCENCPDVVQALNMMAVLNENITHTMVDGEYFQDEINRLKIQGVPSVMDGDHLVHAGKATFADLLNKLEARFESDKSQENKDLGEQEVVVIGGGPAGASAAIYVARKGIKTAILSENFGGQVKETKGIENLISVPYTEGPELTAKLAEHVQSYDINVFDHRRVSKIHNSEDHKILELTSGETLKAQSIIIATGAKWRELGVPGEKEYLGRGVAYCPHCDGPFYKGKDVAVIGGGNSGVEAAIDLAGIVNSVTVFEFMPELKADDVLVKKLESLKNVRVIKNAKSEEVVGNGEKVTSLRYQDRGTNEFHKLDLDGIFVQIGLLPNSGFVKDFVETNKYGEIIIDDKCRTSVKGVYAAGDVTTVPYKQIIISMGEGAKAALTAFEDLKMS